jgi:hypothetical protein
MIAVPVTRRRIKPSATDGGRGPEGAGDRGARRINERADARLRWIGAGVYREDRRLEPEGLEEGNEISAEDERLGEDVSDAGDPGPSRRGVAGDAKVVDPNPTTDLHLLVAESPGAVRPDDDAFVLLLRQVGGLLRRPVRVEIPSARVAARHGRPEAHRVEVRRVVERPGPNRDVDAAPPKIDVLDREAGIEG